MQMSSLAKTGFDISYKTSRLGDNLHEMSKHIISEKIRKKYFKISSAEIITQHA